MVARDGARRNRPRPHPTPLPLFRENTAELKQLQQAALKSDYAYRQTAHLSNNIGPRLTGSAQAEKAVEYVAAELKALGLEVQLEKVMVPHWVRGEETAALVEFPGMAPNTTQKIVLTALGGSVATPAKESPRRSSSSKLRRIEAMGREKVAGKIVLFNYQYDKLWPPGRAARPTGRRWCIAGMGPARRPAWSGGGVIRPLAARTTGCRTPGRPIRGGRAEDSGRGGHGGGRRSDCVARPARHGEDAPGTDAADSA